MATVIRENIGLLHDKLIVKVSKEEYYPSFEKNLKGYAKKANIPGFRAGMVPVSIIKKTYGQSVFTEEVFKTIEKELMDFLQKENINILAQPIPADNEKLDVNMNAPADYQLAFEIGLRPEINIDPKNINVSCYKIIVTDEMINEEVKHLQNSHGTKKDEEVIASEKNTLNVQLAETNATGNIIEDGITKTDYITVSSFSKTAQETLQGKKISNVINFQLSNAFDETALKSTLQYLGVEDNKENADKYFNFIITKITSIETPEMDMNFFESAFPGKEITTEEAFREEIKNGLESYFNVQANNQMHDQIYHELVDHNKFDLPANFLKRWMQTGDDAKTAEEVETTFPNFADSLKWTLISNKLLEDNKIEVSKEEIVHHAKTQLLSYMGGAMNNAPWIDQYIDNMMKDKKYIEQTYSQVQTRKLFQALESQVNAKEESVSKDDFIKKMEQHHH